MLGDSRGPALVVCRQRHLTLRPVLAGWPRRWPRGGPSLSDSQAAPSPSAGWELVRCTSGEPTG